MTLTVSTVALKLVAQLDLLNVRWKSGKIQGEYRKTVRKTEMGTENSPHVHRYVFMYRGVIKTDERTRTHNESDLFQRITRPIKHFYKKKAPLAQSRFHFVHMIINVEMRRPWGTGASQQEERPT